MRFSYTKDTISFFLFMFYCTMWTRFCHGTLKTILIYCFEMNIIARLFSYLHKNIYLYMCVCESERELNRAAAKCWHKFSYNLWLFLWARARVCVYAEFHQITVSSFYFAIMIKKNHNVQTRERNTDNVMSVLSI